MLSRVLAAFHMVKAAILGHVEREEAKRELKSPRVTRRQSWEHSYRARTGFKRTKGKRDASLRSRANRRKP